MVSGMGKRAEWGSTNTTGTEKTFELPSKNIYLLYMHISKGK